MLCQEMLNERLPRQLSLFKSLTLRLLCCREESLPSAMCGETGGRLPTTRERVEAARVTGRGGRQLRPEPGTAVAGSLPSGGQTGGTGEIDSGCGWTVAPKTHFRWEPPRLWTV